MDWKTDFTRGLKGGLAIGLGYIPVSFTFGFMAVSGGLPIWAACLISLTNLTSAGQFAGMNLIFAQAGYMEMAMTSLVINLRYLLMSLSLTQRIEKIPLIERLIMGFGVTDETFVVASLSEGKITFPYFLGLISLPILGWNFGTLMGGCITSLLPLALQNAMGIALYGMFIALIIPAARDSMPVVFIIVAAVAANCIMEFVPAFSFISSGFRIIIATLIGAGSGALLFPKDEETIEAEGVN